MPTPTRSITLEAVARMAGVSKMTASRALRNVGRVSPETVRRVLGAAEELGYRPNPLVQALMASVARGQVERGANLVWATTYRDEARMPWAVKAVWKGARKRALALGFELEFFVLEAEQLSEERLEGILRARGARGVVLGPLSEPRGDLAFPWASFALAAVGNSLRRPALHYALPHLYRAMERVWDEVVGRGHKRVAYLHSGVQDLRSDFAGLTVFQRYQAGNREAVTQASYDGWGVDEFRLWLRASRPDAVIADHSHVLSLLRRSGAVIPTDFSFAALSVAKLDVDCAGVRHAFGDVGAAAVDLVVGQLHRNELGLPRRVKAVLIQGDWQAGGTLTERGANARRGK